MGRMKMAMGRMEILVAMRSRGDGEDEDPYAYIPNPMGGWRSLTLFLYP